MPRAQREECECGRKATVKTVSREWVCEECRKLERETRQVKGRYANKGTTKARYLSYVPKEKKILNFAEMYDTSLSTPLDSLSRLEAMLAEVAR